MTITELALLHLSPTVTIGDETVRAKLAQTKSAMENFTGYKFHYFKQIENPSLIYVVGEWDSLDQHHKEWIPSVENQDLLKELKDILNVEWLIHLDIPPSNLPLPSADGTGPGVVSVGRHVIKDGQRARFEEMFSARKHYYEEYVTEGTIAEAWRMDCDEGKEEFVLWCPWRDVAQHHGFAGTEEFKSYAQLKEVLKDVSIKHLKRLM